MKGMATAPRACAAPMSWTLEDVLTATGGTAATSARRDQRFDGVSTDSRHVERGAVFFALRGPLHDGHNFVAEALRCGAACAVVERAPTAAPADCLIRVGDTLRALGDLAAWTRRRYALRVAAITGSNGKTTTKEMVAAICAAAQFPLPHTRVLKNDGNLNNLIGLPLTLLRLRGDEAVAVVEMGMNHPGEIARLCEIARPDFAVITNVGPAHLEGVGGTLAGVAAAKGELFAGLASDAVIAVNTDDEWIVRLARNFAGRQVTFGTQGHIRARNRVELGKDGVAFELVIGTQICKVRLRLMGAHNVSNALAAAAVGHAMGLSPEVIVHGLASSAAPPMRMQVKQLGNGVTLINDAYNANPSSVEAALVALRRCSGRPVVVLGEMWELGDEAGRAHRYVGERAAALGIGQLFVLGPHADAVVEGARAGGLDADAIHVGGSHAEVAEAVVAHWQPGDTVLVKGSRGMRMEEVVRLLEGAGRSP
jgi:UDP-N-acetylmuramoyl-tripeptide--D-alanyl-D-alanine ligase